MRYFDNSKRKKKFFYIHGFASGKNSGTIKKLETAVGQPVIGLEYDSSASFSTNIRSLKIQWDEYIKNNTDEELLLVGTSLGGFYAIQLANLVNTYRCIVFNPVVYPIIQLKPFADKCHTNFSTGEQFEFTMPTLKSYETATNTLSDFPLTIYVSEADELLKNNTEYVRNKFNNTAKIIYTTTKHRIDNFTPYLEEIMK